MSRRKQARPSRVLEDEEKEANAAKNDKNLTKTALENGENANKSCGKSDDSSGSDTGDEGMDLDSTTEVKISPISTNSSVESSISPSGKRGKSKVKSKRPSQDDLKSKSKKINNSLTDEDDENGKHAEDANNNESKSRENSVEKEDSSNTPVAAGDSDDLVDEKEALQAALQNLIGNFPGIQIPTNLPNNISLEALQNTKMAVAQLAASALNVQNNASGSNPSIQDLAMLQGTLFSLQQQQILQLQLIQQLQHQLSNSAQNSNQGDSSSPNSPCGTPPPKSSTPIPTSVASQQHLNASNSNINTQNNASSKQQQQNHHHHHHHEGEGVQKSQNHHRKIGKNHNSDGKPPSGILAEAAALALSSTSSSKKAGSQSPSQTPSTTANQLNQMGLMRNSAPNNDGLLNPHFASLLNCANQDPNMPLSPGLPPQNSSFPFGSGMLSPDGPEEPNTLEMLQKRAQEVLDSASQGLLASSLANENSKKMGCEKGREPFFKHRCRFCGKVFGSDSALQIHIRSHTGERPFKCNVCGSRFTTKGNLKVHFQRHTSKFPHVKMNPNPIPEHLDHFHPPLLAAGQTTPENSPPHHGSSGGGRLSPGQHPHAGPPPQFQSFNPFNPLFRFNQEISPPSSRPPQNIPPGGYSKEIGLNLLGPQDLTKPKKPHPSSSPQNLNHGSGSGDENNEPGEDIIDEDECGDDSNDSEMALAIALHNKKIEEHLKAVAQAQAQVFSQQQNLQGLLVGQKKNFHDIEHLIKNEDVDDMMDDDNDNDDMMDDDMDLTEDEKLSKEEEQRLIDENERIEFEELKKAAAESRGLIRRKSSDDFEEMKKIKKEIDDNSDNDSCMDDSEPNKDRSGQDQPENLSSKSLPLMYPLPNPNNGERPSRPSSAGYLKSCSPGLRQAIEQGDIDPAKDPAIYSNLLPRPGSNDNAWESLIEITKTSETTKLQQLVDNIEHKLTDPNQCIICHRVLSCKSALQMHYRTHTGERPFKCKICGRAFTTKGNLKTHMGVHRAKPPLRVLHQCPVCHKRFTNSLVLQQHIRLHTGEPTDLTPDQIRAAEVKDPFPSFLSGHPGFPFGSPLPPHHFMGPGMKPPSLMSPEEFEKHREMLIKREKEMMLSDDSDQEQDKDKDMDDEDRDRRKSNSTSPPQGKLNLAPYSTSMELEALENQVRMISTQVNAFGIHPKQLQQHHQQLLAQHQQHQLLQQQQQQQQHKDPTISASISASTHINLPEDLTAPKKTLIRENGLKSPATSSSKNSIDNGRNPADDSDVESNDGEGDPNDWKNFSAHSEGERDFRSPISRDSRITPPTPNQNNGGITPPTFGALDLTPRGQSSGGSVGSGGPGSGLFPPGFLHGHPHGPLPPGHPLMTSSALTNLANSVMSSTAFSPLSMGPIPPGGRPRGNTTCNICLKTFACHSALEIHYRSHTKERPFKCNVCDRGFSTKGNMKQHQLTHKIRDMPNSSGVYADSNNSKSSSNGPCSQNPNFNDHSNSSSATSMTRIDDNLPLSLSIGLGGHEHQHQHNSMRQHQHERHEKHEKHGSSIASNADENLDTRSNRSRSNSPQNLKRPSSESSAQQIQNKKPKQSLPDEEVTSGGGGNGGGIDDLEQQKIDQKNNELAAYTASLERMRDREREISREIERERENDLLREREVRDRSNSSLREHHHRSSHSHDRDRDRDRDRDYNRDREREFRDRDHNRSHSHGGGSGGGPLHGHANRINSDNSGASSPPSKHVCKVCIKSFSSSSSLQIHMRTHTGDKPFVCNVCSKAFTTKGNLKVHMGTHMWTNGASRRGRRMSLELPLGLQFPPHPSMPPMPPSSGTIKGPEGGPRPDLFYPYAPNSAPHFLNGSKFSDYPAFFRNSIAGINIPQFGNKFRSDLLEDEKIKPDKEEQILQSPSESPRSSPANVTPSSPSPTSPPPPAPSAAVQNNIKDSKKIDDFENSSSSANSKGQMPAITA